MTLFFPPEKHSVTLQGHRTSVTLEAPFWEALQRLANAEGMSLNAFVAQIDAERAAAAPTIPLSSVLRVRLLQEVRRGRC
ncbi:MAG: ribbon-helix-helix domain-containing protein [Pseudomonadota bacterium]